MLQNFPLEITLNIVRRLDFQDRLRLATTCHNLKAVISENCLYETLNIKDRDLTESIITKFKNNEFRGSQVKHLKLYVDRLSDELYGELPIIFPNAIRLQNYADNEGPREHYTVRKLLKWKDTLQYYDTRDNTFKVGRLLEKNTFTKIKYAHLSQFFSLDLSMYKSNLNLADCIAHIPFLETLELYLCEVSLSFLEKIHDNCPLLKNLALVQALISTVDESLPEVIVPATHLLCLQISENSSICDSEGQLLEYIIRKYTNLQTLEILSIFDDENLRDLLGEFHLLDANDWFVRNPIAQELHTGHNDALEFYEEEGNNYLSRLPKSLTIIRLNAKLIDDTIEGLQPANLNLTTLELLNFELSNPSVNSFDNMNSLLYIKSQKSLKTLAFSTDPATRFHSPDIISDSVTTLTYTIPFASYCNTMCLGWILSVFPSIEVLNLHSEDAFYSEVDMDTYVPNYNLKELNITHSLSSQKVFDLIKAFAPNVKKLSFNLCGIPYHMSMVLDKKQFYNYPIATNERYETESYMVDISNFDLDTFNLYCELGRHTESYELVDVYYEIKRYAQVKRFLISSCRSNISVIASENDSRLKRASKITVICKRIGELILEQAFPIRFKGETMTLEIK